MKKRKTITEAAIEVLRHSDKTLSVSEIYAKIIENSLYEFHAQNPLSVLRVELRGHAVGIDYPSASSKKYFYMMKLVAHLDLLIYRRNMRMSKKR